MWIQTISGRAYDYLEFNEVNVEDIAKALGRICRYNGHTPKHYSVAEHCCHVGDFLREQGHTDDVVLAGYLHDAHEAYIGDMPSPLKIALGSMSTDFRLIWGILEECTNGDILRSLGCMIDLKHPAVRAADVRVLADEKEALWGDQEPKSWGVDATPIGADIHFWGAETAGEEWLNRVRPLADTIRRRQNVEEEGRQAHVP